MSADEARTEFDALIDMAQREPVQVLRHDRVVGVMVSSKDYAAVRGLYADRLALTLDVAADEARRAGLTPERLDELLADERQ